MNPVFAPDFFGENIAAGNSSAASAVFDYMYEDATSEWGHRGAILQGEFNWVGIGIMPNPFGANAQTHFTDDFGTIPAGYTPPANADTNPPVVGEVSYSNGTAKATGVADSPLNVNDVGATPLTAGVTGVVLYTNNIVETGEQFNTVAGIQTSPGTWTAPITVKEGEVLHAVAVDGSGNFTDKSPPPPAVALTAGTNAIALPAGEAPAAATGAAAAAHQSSANVPAVTPTAAALVASVDKQLRRKVVKDVRVYVGGHWRTYYPGRSGNFALYTNEGVDLQMRAKGKWRPPAGAEPFTAPTVRLHRGWNFVAAPYPIVHMTCHATRLELAHSGDKLEQITVGPSPQAGMIMCPNKKGQWGNDLMMVMPDDKGSGSRTPARPPGSPTQSSTARGPSAWPSP